jgi:hypothetical protein
MRSVCYAIQTVTLKVGQDPAVDDAIFFGPINDVVEELKKLEKLNKQAQIAHATDNEQLAFLMNKEQVIKHLLSHDLDKLPVYPSWGTGESRMRFPCDTNTAYINNVKVSVKGSKEANEPKALTILLPPGAIY